VALVRPRAAAAGAVLLILAGRGTRAAAAEVRPGEYEVKAAYLYNFAKFVEWPPSSPKRDAFVIGILGRDPFGPLLDQAVSGKTVGERRLVVRRFAQPEQVAEVDMIFICASEAARVPDVLRRLEGTPTLTVGETEDFVGRGGMLGFRVSEEVVRFDVDLDQSSRAGLKVSSQLVRVARKVITSRGQ
jgi:uncharacterized protein DUF4154